MRVRSLSMGIVLTAGALLAVFAMAEGMSRLVDHWTQDEDAVYRHGMSYVPAPYLLHMNEPNYALPELHTNALGFRGGPLAEEKASGTFRIVMMGGSAVFGFGASADAFTIPALLEEELRRRFPGYGIEVINAGQGSYVSTQELIQYQTLVSRLQPDAIVVMDGYNDFYFGLRGGLPPGYPPVWSGGGLERALEVTLSPHLSLADIRRPVAKLATYSSLAYRFIRWYAHHEQAGGIPESTQEAEVFDDPALTDVYMRSIRHLAAVAAADGVPMFVALQPVIADREGPGSVEERHILDGGGKRPLLLRVRDYEDQVEQRLSAQAIAGLTPVDVRTAFRHATGTYFIDPVHMNDRGNSLVAHAFADALGVLFPQ